jgi:hypothetical protein
MSDIYNHPHSLEIFNMKSKHKILDQNLDHNKCVHHDLTCYLLGIFIKTK